MRCRKQEQIRPSQLKHIKYLGKASFRRARPHVGTLRFGEEERLFLSPLFQRGGDGSFALPFFFQPTSLPADLQPPGSCLVLEWPSAPRVPPSCPALLEGPGGPLGRVQQRPCCMAQSPCARTEPSLRRALRRAAGRGQVLRAPPESSECMACSAWDGCCWP